LGYNAANQVAAWSYDPTGKLTSDGATSYSDDALNRVLTAATNGQQRAYSSNGDGVLVSQTANGTTTRLTQDLAAPLSQVLQTTA
jgi:uncharacterized protein RhaS with RHS repeats